MSTLVKLPEGFDGNAPNRLIPGEGDHKVKVTSVNNETEGTPVVRFQVVDGADKGLTATQRYDFQHRLGQAAFKGLMDALGIQPEGNGCVDLDAALGKALIVTIAHRTHAGKTYANVVEHHADK